MQIGQSGDNPLMRVAAKYDIHGNLPALRAVLQEVRKQAVDLVVVGGDVVPGPMPRETIECLQNLDLPVQFIQGNGEAAVLAQMRGEVPAVPEQFRDLIRWVADQLGSDHQQFLASWPLTFQAGIDQLGKVLFCHATPRSDTELFTRLTPEDALLPIFEGVEEQVVVCGHSHMQFDRMIGRSRVVNAGSVGMPYGEPGAYWLLLGLDIQFRHTPYDRDKAASLIRATTYPMAEDFAATNVLKPGSEQEAVELLAKMGLK